MVGTAMVYGRVPCLIDLAIAFFALRAKRKTEEQFEPPSRSEHYTEIWG